jgi:hypothetical protein
MLAVGDSLISCIGRRYAIIQVWLSGLEFPLYEPHISQVGSKVAISLVTAPSLLGIIMGLYSSH